MPLLPPPQTDGTARHRRSASDEVNSCSRAPNSDSRADDGQKERGSEEARNHPPPTTTQVHHKSSGTATQARFTLLGRLALHCTRPGDLDFWELLQDHLLKTHRWKTL